MILARAALPTRIGPYVAVLVAGFVIGLVGHMVRSRLLIIAGILIVGAIAAIMVIFAFVSQP